MVRRAYLLKGLYQPRDHEFQYKMFGALSKPRRFNKYWSDQHGSWLEYIIKNEAAYCMPYFLFRPDKGNQGGGDKFVGKGFTNWKEPKRLRYHVGKHDSAHSKASAKCDDLLNQDGHMETLISKITDHEKNDYRVRLGASVNISRFLLCQGLPFCSHDESESSNNQGNYLELWNFLAEHNENINKAMENGPKNDTLKSPMIQKDISNAAATEAVNAIINELKGELFVVLIDESCDISIKEKMVVVLRYVSKKGCVIERFLGIQHVLDTSAVSLTEALENLFAKHGLSIMRLCGKGYDGASNMQGKFNDLKTLIIKDNKSAFYVHCFAHQLQLALVHVVKDLPLISSFFLSVTSIVNVVGVSSKRRDKLRSIQADKVFDSIESGETKTGTSLNQESGLKRACDTRWGTHYNTLINVMVLFSPLIDLFEILLKDRSSSSDLKGEVFSLLDLMQTFGFIFNLHLMKNMLGITDDLSKALQKKNQNIVNVMYQMRSTKERLQAMREKGWCSFLDDVSKFCEKHSIVVPQMEDKYIAPGRSRRKVEEVTNLFHYRVELFYTCIDKQLQELNNRFNEVNIELLLCMASLDPSTTFTAFDKDKLVRLAQFYPDDFSEHKLMIL